MVQSEIGASRSAADVLAGGLGKQTPIGLPVSIVPEYPRGKAITHA